VVQKLTTEERKAKFYFTTLKWMGIFVAACASLSISQAVFMTFGFLYYILWLPLFYWVIPGSVVLFVWASITASKGSWTARKSGFSSDLQKRWANLTAVFATITLILGMVVGSLMFIALSNMWQSPGPWLSFVLPTALLAGLLMIPAQAISMTYYARLNNTEAASSDE
jgi:hypothetical protein